MRILKIKFMEWLGILDTNGTVHQLENRIAKLEKVRTAGKSVEYDHDYHSGVKAAEDVLEHMCVKQNSRYRTGFLDRIKQG